MLWTIKEMLGRQDVIPQSVEVRFVFRRPNEELGGRMPVTYADAVKVAIDGTYKTLPDSDLRQLLAACVDINGPNPIAMHRITHAAEIIRSELAGRESARQHKQTQLAAWIAAVLSALALAVGAMQWWQSRNSKPGENSQGSSAAQVPPNNSLERGRER
jgi:hypothetical protein